MKNINEIKEIIKRGIYFFNVGFCIVKSASRYGDKSARGRFSARERVASFEDSNAASLIVINEKSARSGRRKTRFSSRACLAACSTAATFSHPCSTIFFGFLTTEISLSLSLTSEFLLVLSAYIYFFVIRINRSSYSCKLLILISLFIHLKRNILFYYNFYYHPFV